MRKLHLILILLAFTFLAQAQEPEISVKSFQPLPMDMTASSLEGKRIDQNNEVCALIKIVTTQTGFTFEAGALGIVDTKQEAGEVWVWVPRGSRKLTVKHPKLGVLRDYRYPVEIMPERTYEMKLTTATIETIVKEQVRQQYLAFKITPPNATLEVNDQLWSVEADGSAMQYVDFGTYTYRVRAANYHPDAGLVTVDDPDNTKLVTVTLKPDFAEVTLKVDADAEIWVNNEKKGVRSWTGGLGKGVYRIECRQAGHESTLLSKEITSEMNGQTIMLTAPRPIYGSLMVESTPNFAKLYVDGQDMGNTPKSINEILVGQHEIRLTQDGYADHTETVTIAKGEKKLVKAVMLVTQESTHYDEGQNKITTGGREPVEKVIVKQHPRPRSWEEVIVSTSLDDVKGMTFRGEVTKASGWGGSAGSALGYKNAVKMIQKDAFKKGCNLIVVIDADYGMSTRVTARLYSYY